MATSFNSRLSTAPEEGCKAPCVTVSLTNITLSGEQTIGAVAVVAGDRVLTIGQTDSAENGIWVCNSSAWARAKDWNTTEDVVSGVLVPISNPATLYQANIVGDFSPGVTSVSFTNKTSDERIIPFATMALAVADTGHAVGDVLLIKDRDGAIGDIVLSSGVTENTYNIIQCTGVATLSIVIRVVGRKINFAQFGASSSASAAVNAGAINAGLTYFAPVSGEIADVEYELPPGDYAINDVLTFPSTTTPEAHRCKVIFNGRLLCEDNTKHGIVFNKLYECEIKTPVIYSDSSSAAGWADNTAGVVFNHNVETCNIHIGLILGGYKYGVWHHPNQDTMTQFTKFYVDKIYGPKYSMYFEGNVGNAASYFSSNDIYGGAFNNSYFTSLDGSESLHYTNKVTNLNFYGPNFATVDVAVNFTTTTGVNMYGPYYDSFSGSYAGNLTAATNLVWIHGAGTAFEDLNWIITGDSRNQTFMNTSKYSGGGSNMLISSNGLSFLTPASKDIDYLQTLSFTATQNTVYMTDPFGQSQRLNKDYTTNASAPTAGTYDQGAIAWNTSAISAGQPSGWMCKTYGTAGTLNGGATTGSITSGLSALTVSSVTGLKYGQHISVAGAVTGQTIVGITGLVVTLSGTASATVSGAAVSFYNPTWQSLPNFI